LESVSGRNKAGVDNATSSAIYASVGTMVIGGSIWLWNRLKNR
jgi:hypothetical protein